jgi:amino acid adenylation domain-containing protein
MADPGSAMRAIPGERLRRPGRSASPRGRTAPLIPGSRPMLQDWVTQGALERPDAPAVVGEDVTMTYAQLEDYSNRLAALLRLRGCRRGDRVAVLMPRSAHAVASFIGVLKAGCTYVPLDPAERMVRAAQILRQVEPRVILAGGCDRGIIENLRSRRALGDAVVGWLGPLPPPLRAAFTLGDVAMAPPIPPLSTADPDDVAYILFTRGIGGRPRGVPTTHRSLRAFIDWAKDYFELGPGDRLAGHSALTFHLSAFDIYGALAAGAQLHQIPAESGADPHALARLIEERRLTVWCSVPMPIRRAARFGTLEDADCSSLRHVAWCGDVLPTCDLLYWRHRLPDAKFTNLYGSSETTIASSYFRVPDDFDGSLAEIPIGTACPGEELLVLDDDLQVVDDGAVGDLYVRGVGLSPGYWQDPERSQADFPRDPRSTDGSERLYRTGDRGLRGPDGMVRFLGRADLQIEGSSHPVEAGVIEHALLQLEEVAACAVVPVKASILGGQAVGCAYVPSNGKTLRTAELQSRLAGRLRPELIPSRWLILDELPVDGHGKVDRALARTLMGG